MNEMVANQFTFAITHNMELDVQSSGVEPFVITKKWEHHGYMVLEQ